MQQQDACRQQHGDGKGQSLHSGGEERRKRGKTVSFVLLSVQHLVGFAHFSHGQINCDTVAGNGFTIEKLTEH